MDTASFTAALQEYLFLLLVFGCFLVYAISAGRQSITNIILGLYFALLISIEFPFYNVILGSTSNEKTESILMLVVFAAFTLGGTILFARLMPREYSEKKFEGFWKKLLLACGATILVMAFSYHALPVTDLITPGSPIQYLFGSENSFFYWLIAPIVVLFIV
jgi:high-affinity Fe2+/Pb2+ permease